VGKGESLSEEEGAFNPLGRGAGKYCSREGGTRRGYSCFKMESYGTRKKTRFRERVEAKAEQEGGVLYSAKGEKVIS